MEILNTSFLKPIFEGSDKFGINIQKTLKKSDLKYFDYKSDEAYVPMLAANQFLSLLCDEQGIDDVATVFSDFIQISALTDFSSLLVHSLTLLDACLIAERMSNCILSNEILKLNISGNKVIFSQCFSNLSPIEYERIVQINLIYLLNGFKAIAPKNWAPTEVYFQSSVIPAVIEKLISFSQTKIYLNQPTSAVIFATEELITVPDKITSQLSDEHNFISNDQNTLSYKIEALFNSYRIDCLTPTIAKISYMLGVNERTLRRKLKEEALTFEGILSSWRIRQAISLLKNKDLSIEYISQRLYYNNPKNFSRAFRQVFQLSPSRYRETLNT